MWVGYSELMALTTTEDADACGSYFLRYKIVKGMSLSSHPTGTLLHNTIHICSLGD